MENISTIFSGVGLVIGIASLIYLAATFRSGPEALRGGILQLILGISTISLAFLWHIIFVLNKFEPISSLDLHHFFVAMSIFFFANAARKFYAIGR